MLGREDDRDLERFVREVVITVKQGLEAAKQEGKKAALAAMQDGKKADFAWTDRHAIHGEGVVSICEGLLGQLGPALCDPFFPEADDEPPGRWVREALGHDDLSSCLVSWEVIQASVDRLVKASRLPVEGSDSALLKASRKGSDDGDGEVTFPATPYIVRGLWASDFTSTAERYSNPFAAALVVRALVALFRLLAKPSQRLQGNGPLDPDCEDQAGELLGAALLFLINSKFDVQDAVDKKQWRPTVRAAEYRGIAWSWGNAKEAGLVKAGVESSLHRPSVFFTANACQALAAYLCDEHPLRRRGGAWVAKLPDRMEVQAALRGGLLWLESEGEAEVAQFTAPGEWGEWGREGKHELILDAYALLALDEGWDALGMTTRFENSEAAAAGLRRLYGATRLDGGVDAAYHTIGGQPGDPWVILFPWEDYSFPYLYLQLLCNILRRYPRSGGRGVGEWIALPLFPNLIRDGWDVVLREGRFPEGAGPGPAQSPSAGWNRLEYRVYCTSWGLCAAAKLLETIVSRDEESAGKPLWGRRILEPRASEAVFIALERTLMDRRFFTLFAQQVAGSIDRQFRHAQGVSAPASRD